MLVGTYKLNLLSRHLFLSIFFHDTVAHASRVTANKLIIIISFTISRGRLQKLIFLSALFISNLRFVLSFNLTIVEGVPIDISEEGMLFHFLGVTVRAQSRRLVSVQKHRNDIFKLFAHINLMFNGIREHYPSCSDEYAKFVMAFVQEWGPSCGHFI